MNVILCVAFRDVFIPPYYLTNNIN